ncbi:MAG: epoxyqueuosine reductase [Clostridia bacterium]|nr:epoxyqueuosine reductase [Clostridia bacterium]
MVSSKEVKELAISLGADLCGIAPVDRFVDSPKGFHPTDIYSKCKSVIVFVKKMPSEIIMADSLVPYSHNAFIIYPELDKIGLELSRVLEKKGVSAVPVPCDTPYEYWDAEISHGMGILSMRHAGYLAGLGVLGKNTLLVNKELGNMVYIGAVLADIEFEPDPVITESICPPNCRICLEACPQKALDGITANQALCRQGSISKTGRGFDLYKCNSCRKACPKRSGSKCASKT